MIAELVFRSLLGSSFPVRSLKQKGAMGANAISAIDVVGLVGVVLLMAIGAIPSVHVHEHFYREDNDSDDSPYDRAPRGLW
mmetsp:Transcript_167128/g.536798  ORF Transcript_167128/g.536798 Transcript_167128/m.536798 type:complete len:81 (+) Transcript_167128:26-268(+)